MTQTLKTKTLRSALAAGLAIGLATFGGASYAANAGTTADATVIVPIAISAAQSLQFGRFAPGTGGSVTVDTGGTRTGTGVVLSSVANATPVQAARFNVTGDPGATYAITITAPTSLSDGATTPNTMAITTFSDLTGGGATSGNVTTGTLTGGAQSIYFGGTLTVGASQAAGNYTGNLSVAVEYN